MYFFLNIGLALYFQAKLYKPIIFHSQKVEVLQNNRYKSCTLSVLICKLQPQFLPDCPEKG